MYRMNKLCTDMERAQQHKPNFISFTENCEYRGHIFFQVLHEHLEGFKHGLATDPGKHVGEAFDEGV
jgi:hypothetical protein